MMDEIAFWTRVVNGILGLVCFCWYLIRTSHYWNTYPLDVRFYTISLLFFVFAVTYGSGEIIAQDEQVAFGYRIFLVTLAEVALLAALWKGRGLTYKGIPKAQVM